MPVDAVPPVPASAPAPVAEAPAEPAFQRSVFEAPAAPRLFEAAPPPPVAAPAPAPAPAAREPIADDLPLPDLAQRLTDAVRRRREARAAAALPVAAPVAAPVAEAVPAPASALAPAVAAAPVLPELPASLRPVQTDPLGDDGGELTLPSLLPPRLPAGASARLMPAEPAAPAAPLAMPAAMRPVGTDFSDDPHDTLDSILPPRRLSVTAPVAAQASDLDDDDDDAEDDDAEDGTAANEIGRAHV